MNPKWNKLISLLDQALVSGSNFIQGVLLARLLGLDIYGIYTLGWMAVLFGLSINQACITKPMLTIAAKEKDSSSYLSTVHLLQLLFVGAIILLGLIGCGIGKLISIETLAYSWLPILSIIIGLELLHDFYRKYFFSQQKILLAFGIDGVMYGGQLLGLVILYSNNILRLDTFLISILISDTLSCFLGFVLSSHRLFKWDRISVVIKRHFHFSKWLLGTSILQWLSGNFFIIVSAGILGPIAVGAVRIAQNIMGLCHIFFQVMENIVPVEAAQHYTLEGIGGLINYLKKTSLQMGLFVGGLLLCLLLTAPFLLEYLYGATYKEYAYIITGFSLMYVFVYIGYPLRFALRTLEVTKPIFIAYVISTLFSVLSAHWMIQAWQINGLILGMAICQIASLLTYAYFLHQILREQQAVYVEKSQKIAVLP